jgi:hypothetical protein
MEDKKVAYGKAEHAGAVIENVRNEATSPPPLEAYDLVGDNKGPLTRIMQPG